MRKDVPIVFTIDGKARSRVWLDVALSSLRKTLGDDITVYVCSNSTHDCAVGFGYNSIAIDVSDVIKNTALSRLDGLKFQGKVRGAMQIFRLALPVVPELKKHDKFIFIDADVEFRSQKWASLFDIDLGDKEVGMAEDQWPINDKWQCESMRVFQDVCGICCDEARERLAQNIYYGAGVVIFNERKLLEKGDYEERLSAMLDSLITYEFKCLDQDALNYAMTVMPIDPRYDAWERNIPKGGEAWLWHYAGPAKFDGVYPPDIYKRIAEKGKLRDILYVVGRDEGDNQRNLRYSLRSLDRYANGVGRIIVAGYPPSWLSDDVVKINIEQPYTSPYRNVMYTIVEAIKKGGISGHFLLASDDYMLVKPTDMANYPFYFRGYGIPNYKANADDKEEALCYKWMRNKTRSILTKYDLPTVDFGSHRFNHGHAEIIIDKINLSFEEVDPPTAIGNMWLAEDPKLPLEIDEDFKIMAVPPGGLKYDLNIPSKRECISYDDVAWTDANFRGFVEREFGEKCRYEKS